MDLDKAVNKKAELEQQQLKEQEAAARRRAEQDSILSPQNKFVGAAQGCGQAETDRSLQDAFNQAESRAKPRSAATSVRLEESRPMNTSKAYSPIEPLPPRLRKKAMTMEAEVAAACSAAQANMQLPRNEDKSICGQWRKKGFCGKFAETGDCGFDHPPLEEIKSPLSRKNRVSQLKPPAMGNSKPR